MCLAQCTRGYGGVWYSSSGCQFLIILLLLKSLDAKLDT